MSYFLIGDILPVNIYQVSIMKRHGFVFKVTSDDYW